MSFQRELADLLPEDLPNRTDLIAGAAAHLDLITEANSQFNLTRITGEREAAIKHVLDSVIPWRLFAEATHVMDIGTGAGFPGIPLAIVLPEVRFTLVESIGKKARFVVSAVEKLGLPNAEVSAIRAEDSLRTIHPQILTGRAVAPVSRVATLFGAALKKGARALLYKGPDAQAEIEAAHTELRKSRLTARIVHQYELPEAAGTRTIVEIKA